jgi:nucleoside-diphosphate-sugar epimerase
MHALVIGAAGMIGRKLIQRLCLHPRIGNRELTRLTLADVVPVAIAAPPGLTVASEVADMADPAIAARLVALRPDVIFHVAATVMGQAESEIAAGYRINFDTVRIPVEAISRLSHYRPRFVYASSTAVFSPPFPDVIPEHFPQKPSNSYGTQKAMAELLLSDYARLGRIDAVGLRLPTIVIRPGKPTAGNSGFFSNILREPLAGRDTVLPVGEDVRHWFGSPRAAVGYLLHAAAMDTAGLGADRHLTMPGFSATVEEALGALVRFAGRDALRHIRREPDAAMIAMAATLPRHLDASRALSCGFRADLLGPGPELDFNDIIRIHAEDDLNSAAPDQPRF